MLIAHRHCVLARYHHHPHRHHLLALSRVAAQEESVAGRSLTTLVAAVQVMRQDVRVVSSKTRFSESLRGRQHKSYKIIHFGARVKDIFDTKPVPALERLTSTSTTTIAGPVPVEDRDEDEIAQDLRAYEQEAEDMQVVSRGSTVWNSNVSDVTSPRRKRKMSLDDGEPGSPNKRRKIA